MRGGNLSLTRRMLWKEYRALRGLWLGVLGLVVLGCVLTTSIEGPDRFGLSHYLFSLAVGAAALYALGCVSATIGGEFEEGTQQWMQALPVSPARLAAQKLLFVMGSTLAFLGCSLVVAAYFSGWRPPATHEWRSIFALWGIATLEGIAYGFLFAVVIRKPLLVMFVTIAAVWLVIAVFSTPTIFNLTKVPSSQLYEAADPFRLALLALVAVVDVWLARRWLWERGTSDPRRASRLKRWLSRSGAGRRMVQSRPNVGNRQLLWQGLRQMRWYYLALPAAPILFWMTAGPSEDFFRTGGASAGLLFFAALLGGVTFLGDQQRRSYLFFGERGISGHRVWCTRQAPPMIGLIAIYVVFTYAQFYQRVMFGVAAEYYSESQLLVLSHTLRQLSSLVLVYSAGQFCSMLLRSGLLAAVSGMALALVLLCWALLMNTLGVPHWWSVWLIAIGLLAATLVRAPSWVIDRGGWHGWRTALAVLAAPLFAIALVLPAYRVYSVPNVDPGIDVQAYLRGITPEARETAAMYRRAWELCRFADREDAERHREGVALCIEASQRPSCAFFDPRHDELQRYYTDLQRMVELAFDVIGAGTEQQSMVDLPGMVLVRMSNHLREYGLPMTVRPSSEIEQRGNHLLANWVHLAGQDKAVVTAVLELLEQVQQQAPPDEQLVKSNYAYGMRALGGDPRVRMALLESRSVLTYWLGYLPWERARAERVLRAEASEALQALSRARESVAQGRGVELAHGLNSLWWVRTTPLVKAPEDSPLPRYVAVDYAMSETRRRAARLQLGLVWWQLDRGFEAKELKRLVPEVFEREPTDPFTGKSFEYLPGGLPVTVAMSFSAEPGFWIGSTVIPRDTSFLWSPGLMAAPTRAQVWWERMRAGDTSAQMATQLIHEIEQLKEGLAFLVGRPNR